MKTKAQAKDIYPILKALFPQLAEMEGVCEVHLSVVAGQPAVLYTKQFVRGPGGEVIHKRFSLQEMSEEAQPHSLMNEDDD